MTRSFASSILAAAAAAVTTAPPLACAMTPNPRPFTHVQPDGTSVRLKQTGRPGRRLVVDENGYTCMLFSHLEGGNGIGGDAERDILRGEGQRDHDRDGDGDGDGDFVVDGDDWYVYAAHSPSGDGSLISSGLRCGIDDPSSVGLERGISPRVSYGSRRQLKTGGGSTTGYECGEYCHPDKAPRRRDILEDLMNGGDGGTFVDARGRRRRGRGRRNLKRGDGGKEERENIQGGIERDPYNPELPADLPVAVPLERWGQQEVPAKPTAHPLPAVVSSTQENSSERGLTAKKVLKNLVICFRFADHAPGRERYRDVPDRSSIQALMSANPGTFPPQAPTGSVRHMFQKMSYDKFEVVSDVLEWITLPDPYTEAYCADGASGLSRKMHECIVKVLKMVNDAGVVNWGEYDVYENGGQGNGEIDSLALFHSGYASEFDMGPDCHNQPTHNRIWSHEWSLSDMQFTGNDGTVVNFYPINSALWGTCGNEIGRIGVVAHEMAHFLGLYDLYDLRGDAQGFYGYGIGYYGLMGNAWGYDYSQLYSRPLCPWSRFSLGWIFPTLIESSGIYSLSASYDEPDVMIIRNNGFPTGEYLILENVHEDYQPFGGLVIYHIDNGVYDIENPSNTDYPVYNEFDGYPGLVNAKGSWPQNGYHYRVAVLQADGNYDLEHGYNEGDPYDVYSKCWVDEITPSRANGDGPHPNTDAYQHGNIQKTGIRIHDVGYPAPKLTFSVDLASSYEAATSGKQVKSLLPTWSNPAMQMHFTTFGTMFHVHARRAISILGFDINADYTDERELEIKALAQNNKWIGDSQNTQYSPAEWTSVPLFKGMVKGRGLGCRTRVDLPQHKPLPAQNLLGFYVTFTNSDVMALGYPDPSRQGEDLSKAIHAENDDVAMTLGFGKVYPFGGGYANAIPNVGLRYAIGLNGVPPTAAPTPSPTPAPVAPIEQRTGVDTSLTTTFERDNQANGNMFDLETLRDVRITSFSVHADSTHEAVVKVYHREGSFFGFETDMASWGPPVCLHTVTGAGEGRPTDIPSMHCSPLNLYAGTTHSFYVRFEKSPNADREMKMLYTFGVRRGTVAAENGDIRILEGVGTGSSGGVYEDRVWNGIVHYTAL